MFSGEDGLGDKTLSVFLETVAGCCVNVPGLADAEAGILKLTAFNLVGVNAILYEIRFCRTYTSALVKSHSNMLSSQLPFV